ncbi:MAG: four helix bundle protein [Candidatus Berkelbacteria bacterium]|nr:four helix bundle protein [Candidatus Berkelbacteria bacterium]
MSDTFHQNNSQSNFPPVIERLKSAYKQWILIERNLPKCERFGIGQKVDNLFTDLLDLLQKASFAPMDLKISLLSQALSTIDSLRFFIQLCWELKLIPANQFTQIGGEIEDIGKMVGGWRRGLITKTSAEAKEKS